MSEAIFNPCSPKGMPCSPGNAVNPAARKDMRAAQANGVTFYGYIWTGGGQVSTSKVEQKVREYASWYGLHDIFFDGASTNCAKESGYYLALFSYVHSRHGKVILNPGTQPPACYMRASDQISVFEGLGSQLAAYSPAHWMAGYSAARFIIIVHTTAGRQAMMSVVARAAQHDHVGNVYATSLRLPNPYSGLPGYWREEVTKVSTTFTR